VTRAALGLLLAWGLGCAHWPPGVPRVASCPGPLVDAAAIPGGDFLLRERARVDGPGAAVSLALTVERRGDRLVLVAIDPFGARAFSVVQTGMDLEIDDRMGRAGSLDPATLLADLHAARFSRPDSEERAVVARPGCEHTTTFVRTERRAL